MALQEYKCPNCGKDLKFDSQLQKMKCSYCGTECEVAALEALDADLKKAEQVDELKWDINAGTQWQEAEMGTLRSYSCNSCGGEIVGDETTAASKCPYCDSPVVMKGQFTGALRPDYVIPFKLDNEAAKEAFLKHLKGKRLLPKVFINENHIDEVKGIYVPFWLFDADVGAAIQFKATKIRTWSDSSYNYTETSYYSAYRAGSLGFDHIPVDGSSKMPDDMMESIEPYDYSQAVDFQTAYLSGYLADKYDVTTQQCVDRANERVKKSTEENFRATVKGYSSVIMEKSSVKISNGKAKYALLPVWILNTKWNGKKFMFAMNGQTGKFVGDLPLDKGALRKWRVLLFFAFAASVTLLSLIPPVQKILASVLYFLYEL
jgi:DNA-directed RNA polymerase subunit RPC12/RpoP